MLKTYNSKIIYRYLAIAFVIMGLYIAHFIPIVSGAGVVASLRVYSNGGTVYGTSKNSGVVGCTITVPGADYCFVVGGFVDGKDTLTVKIVPPSGKVLDSWNTSYCSDTSVTCSVEFSKVVDGDGMTTVQPDGVYLKPTYKTAVIQEPVTKPAPVESPKPTSTTTQQTTATEDTNNTAPTKEKPIVDFAMNGKAYATESKQSFQYAEKIQLAGTTFANANVTLYIFSEPRVVSVTANDAGEWTYDVSDLEPGDHRIEVQATDPESNETSERIVLANFTVAEDANSSGSDVAQNVAEATESNTPSSWVIVSILSVGVVAVVMIVLFVKKRRKNNRKQAEASVPEVAQNPSMTSTNESESPYGDAQADEDDPNKS